MVSSGSKTSSPIGIVVGTVVVITLIALAAKYPIDKRMPPDPFQEDELKEVTLEVEWEGNFRTQLIAWDVGDDDGEFETMGQENVTSPGYLWRHITTARSGVTARVSSIQSDIGPILCAIYVDERQIAADNSSSKHGCFAEATIP